MFYCKRNFFSAYHHRPHRLEPGLGRDCASRAALASLLLCLGLQPSVAHAAEPPRAGELEEVLVTAELRTMPWLQQPASSSVIPASAIRERAAAHLENVLLLAPNINIAGGSSRARFYQVRGIGERSQFVEPLNHSVGLLIDNIDFSGLGAGATLFDMEQVEILRGPQGTLHGANALAGLINMRSAAPSDTASARLQSTVGDYGRRELGAVVSGPLGSDSLLYRVAAFQHRSDGFIENTFLGRDDTNERDEQLFRGRLRWLPRDNQQVDLSLTRLSVDNGYDAFSLDNTRETLSDMPGRDRQESDALGLTWQVDGAAINSQLMLSLADSASEYSYDEDWSFVGIAPGLEYSSFDRYLRDRRSHSAQLRLSSSEPLSLAAHDLQWVWGLYWLEDDEKLRRQYTYLSEDFQSRYRASTVATYGQLDVDLAPQWSLSAGLRLANRDMRYADSQEVSAAPEDFLWGGKLSLQYESERLGMVYAALSRGYRAGGVNAGILASAADGQAGDQTATLRAEQFFDEELLYNIELGLKRRSANGRLQSALTLFYMDRRDQQVRGSLTLPREDGSTAFIDFTDNAASGYNLGLEWELRAKPADRFELYFNLGLLRARFDSYVNADGADLGGREQAHAPAYQFATGLTYRPATNWQADLQVEGRDGFYFSDRHNGRSSAFQLLHLRVAYTRSNWELALWGRNLLDEDYFVRGFGSFGNDPRKGYALEEYRQFADPRQLGLTLELRL
ncbi:MAG: iron complex outermembrane receptor protein [Halieaceae bacterium]|jgi:iron complex outermembrane receptor protein